MKGFLSSVVFALLVGCSTPPPQVRVVAPPPPPVIEMPARPLLPETATVEMKVRAIADYVLLLRARLEEAIIALEVYREAPQPPP